MLSLLAAPLQPLFYLQPRQYGIAYTNYDSPWRRFCCKCLKKFWMRVIMNSKGTQFVSSYAPLENQHPVFSSGLAITVANCGRMTYNHDLGMSVNYLIRVPSKMVTYIVYTMHKLTYLRDFLRRVLMICDIGMWYKGKCSCFQLLINGFR